MKPILTKFIICVLFVVPTVASAEMTKEQIRFLINHSAAASCQQTERVFEQIQSRKDMAEFKAGKSNMNPNEAISTATICFAIGQAVGPSFDVARFVNLDSAVKTAELSASEIAAANLFVERIDALAESCGINESSMVESINNTEVKAVDFSKVEKTLANIRSNYSCTWYFKIVGD